MKKWVPLSLSLVIWLGCASQLHEPGRILTLERLETLKPGKANCDDSILLFGKPDMIRTEEDGSGFSWLYFEGKHPSTRVSLYFNSKDKKLEVAGWFVNEDEPEADLNYSIKKYQLSHVVPKEAEWTNPHMAPSEVYYIDFRRGIEVEYNKYLKKVEGLTWRVPNQKLEDSSARTPSTKQIN